MNSIHSRSSQSSAWSSCAFSAEKRSLDAFIRRVLLVPAFLILPALFGAGGPPPTTVQGHVSVEGVVEVLNDVLRQPFNETRQISATSSNGSVSFDVPAGKRLVIETISLRVTVTSGVPVRVDGSAVSQGSEFSIDVPISPQGMADTFGNEFFRGMQAVKIRVDGTSLSNEINFSYSRFGGGITTLRVTLNGYLVDLTL